MLLTKAALEEAVDNIRGAVMIAFPQGLPDWDLVRQALEGSEELAGTSVSSSCCTEEKGRSSLHPTMSREAGGMLCLPFPPLPPPPHLPPIHAKSHRIRASP